MQTTQRKDLTSERSDTPSNVFSIPSGAAFLRTLAEAIVSGQLEAGDETLATRNPNWLADSIIFLPTRRAARALGVELLEATKRQTGASAVLLPKIRTIGDLEEEETLFGLDEASSDIFGALPDNMKVIDPAKKQLILARLAQHWVEAMTPTTRALLEKEDIILPSSASDALHLASDLARFMDQIEAEEGNWQEIKSISPDIEGEWWQLTLNFLTIVMDTWPKFLNDSGLVNPSAFRNEIIDFRIKTLEKTPPKGLVIAAGTTGSIPATARLLAKIKSMAQGRIILPGLDLNLPTHIIHQFCDAGEMSGETVASTHPQFGMVKLLDKLKTNHAHVASLGEVATSLENRERILNTVLLPADQSNQWIKAKETLLDDEITQAFEHVSLIEASGEYEEAQAISLILREALSEPNKTAALVTPDRRLAQRVSVELERYNIEIDDSAGEALLTSKPALLLRQLLSSVFSKDDPVTLSSLLKNDLIRLGYKESPSHHLELLELALVRDAIILPALDQLGDAVDQRREAILNSKYAPSALKKLVGEDWEKLKELAGKISDCTKDLVILSNSDELISPDRLVQVIKQTGEALSKNEEDIPQIYEYSGGAELLGFLDKQQIDNKAGFQFHPRESEAVFDALLSGKRTRTAGRTRPRIHIYGALEARLQNSDVLILAGLNEGVWPQTTNNDPYLNRPMRAALNLPLPERRIGLAAHDFVQFSGNREVFYTRSLRVDDAPTIGSRWLQRLKTFIGSDEAKRLTDRGNTYLEFGKKLDAPTSAALFIKPPEPCPPVSARPNRLSITEIETWIRDPYAIYAKHILGLYALPPLVREADAALRGTIYHDILARFTDAWKGRIDENARVKFFAITDAIFAEQNLPLEVLAEWQPRFKPVGEAFLEWEASRRDGIHRSHCEIKLNATIGDTGFILHGYADRIDENLDGSLTIIDYKTGNNPSMKQARTFSPQLSLEAALAMKGDVTDIAAKPIKEMLYVRLKPGDDFKIDDVAKGQKKTEPVCTADELAQNAYDDLIEQIMAYRQPEQKYLSQYVPLPNKTYAGDYDHLARIREWSIGADEEGGASNP